MHPRSPRRRKMLYTGLNFFQWYIIFISLGLFVWMIFWVRWYRSVRREYYKTHPAIRSKREPPHNYSSVLLLRPEDYARELSFHTGLEEADKSLLDIAAEYLSDGDEAVEYGCAFGRCTRQFRERFPNNPLTAIDKDTESTAFTRNTVEDVNVICASVENYKHPRPVKVFFSQGVHHHMNMHGQTSAYLQNLKEQIEAAGGVIIICDEVLPPYKDPTDAGPKDRQVASLGWHAQVIAEAQRQGREILPLEEALTVLDDMFGEQCYKSEEQVQLILKNAEQIAHIWNRKLRLGKVEARQLLARLIEAAPDGPSGVPHYDGSRGDCKRSAQRMREEIYEAGLHIIKERAIGRIDSIGGFNIFVLEAKR